MMNNRKSALNDFLQLALFFKYPFVLLILHIYMARVLHLHAMYWWLDNVEHLLGGILITHSYYLVIKYSNKEGLLPHIPKPVMLILLFTMTGTTTVLWEFAEYTLDYFFDLRMQGGVADTMSDMFLGIVGGVTVILAVWRRK